MSKNEMITLPRSVVEQALEALTCTGEHDDPGHRCTHCDDYVDRNGPARAALRAALEQTQVEQQPVATVSIKVTGSKTTVDLEWGDLLPMLPAGIHQLYTRPQPNPVTDEQIWELYCDWHKTPGGCYGFARAIEAHHGIK